MKKSSLFVGWDCFLAVTLLGLSALGLGQAKKSGSPEKNLPSNIIQLTGFGERAAWSPDGKRIAFMSKSFGDAFEIDLETKMTRLLTGHFLHKGFLRVQYLPNGDFFLIGARTFEDIRATRSRDQEMWALKADAKEPPVPLNHKISEGVAISRKQMKIAWSNTRGQYPDQLAEGESVIYTRKVTVYRKIPDEYNEVEGIFPDGKYTLVESSREQGGPERQNSRFIDIWKLKLEPNSADYVRMTHWGDYESYKASNPVVSPDGNWFAFQSARNNEPAGVGHGIFLYKLKQ